MKKLANFIIKYPIPIILAILLITVFFGAFLPRLERESDIKKLLPANAESVLTYNEIDEKFGGADHLIIIIEDEYLFDQTTLTKIREITEEIKDVPGVSSVLSITDLDEIKPTADGIEVSPLLREIPSDQAVLNKFKQKLLSDGKYAGKFVSRDGQAALILAKLFVDRDNVETVREAKALLEKYKGPENILVTGSPEISLAIMEGISSDLLKLIPLVILLVALILFLAFRSWYGVVLPLVSVAFATIWSMGLMALINKPITVIGSAIPVLLASIGSAYGIHLIARFDEADTCSEQKELLVKALTKTGLAILIAAATTAVGFAANIVSDITAIRTFGLVTAFGIFSAFIITITFIPAVLSLMNCSSRKAEQVSPSDSGLIGKLLNYISYSIINRKSYVIPITIVLVIIAALGYPRLSTETNPIRYFREKSQVVQSSRLVKEKFGGVVTLDLVLKGNIKDPKYLGKIEQLQQNLAKVELLDQPYSIIDALKETNQYMNNNDPKFKKLPETREGIAQYLLFLSMSGSDFLEHLVTSDQEEMIMSFRVATTSSGPVDKMIEQTKAEVNKIFPQREVEVKYSGMSVIFKDMREMLISNQIQSLLIALVVVFFMIFIFYRTWIGAFYCMVPILMTLMLNFGIMGWFNIALDVATVLVSSLTVGLGIDYSVHLFNRYKEERLAGQKRIHSLDVSLRNVGKPIIYNAASVAFGFLILLFSSFNIMRNFGILIALTMVFSSFGALAILPELLMIKVKVSDLKTAWKARQTDEN